MVRAELDDLTYSKNQKPALYAPSWVDRVHAWVRQLPGPSGLYYLGLGLFLFLIQMLVLWIEGGPLADNLPMQGYIAAVIAFFFALWNYLDSKAGAALSIMRPILNVKERVYKKVEYQVTTLPSRWVLGANVIGIAVPLVTEAIGGGPYQLEALARFPVSAALFRFLYLICWLIFGGFLCHTIHQLRYINRIYTKYTQVDLFQMMPLYAFARLTAVTAVSITVVPYGFLAVNRVGFLSDPIIFTTILIIQVLAVMTFVWPQLGIHRLQVAEKEHLLNEVNQRFAAVTKELHHQIDEGQLEGAGDLNSSLENLEIERNRLKEIPTWPWQPETARWLVTALVLPLGLWLLQIFLQRLLKS
jgi:hypothetical protein